MTAAERDAAIAALERMLEEMGNHVTVQSHLGPTRQVVSVVTTRSLVEVIDAEIARLRQEGPPVERDELKDALLWHWAANGRLRRIGGWGTLTKEQRIECAHILEMRDAATKRVRELLEVGR